jgi:hypothetical protein
LLKNEEKESWTLHFTDRMFWLKDERDNNKAVAERVLLKKKNESLNKLICRKFNYLPETN